MVKLIRRYSGRYKGQYIVGSLAKLAEAFLELLAPLLMANIINHGIPTGDSGYIFKQGGLLLALTILAVACALICQYTASLASQGTGTNMRNGLLGHIATLSYKEIDSLSTSTLINRMTSDINNVQQAVAMLIRLMTRAPFLCIGAVVMSLWIDVKLTLIFLCVIPLLAVIILVLMKITSGRYTLAQQQLDQLALTTRENLSGVRVIRAFAGRATQEKRFTAVSCALRKASIKVADMSALMNPTTSVVMNAALILLLFFGARQVEGGRLLAGDILALSTYATKILYALLVASNLVVIFTKAIASARRINQVLDTENTLAYPLDEAACPRAQGEMAVVLDHIKFAYSSGEDVCAGLNLSIKRGETLGIIGATGSGKSTLSHLMQRFYDPQEGRVLLQGSDIKSYGKSALHELIGVVPQRATLFSGSIADNVRWGKEDATDAQVIWALKTAQAYEFVEKLPLGIHSFIEEGGKNLSGGQKQRLAIARGLVSKPPILILDDSLSALDYTTDRLLRDALKTELGDCTLIIISQRISSILSADHIVVMEDGQIVGEGAHDDLLGSCALYSTLYRFQTQSEGTGGAAR